MLLRFAYMSSIFGYETLIPALARVPNVGNVPSQDVKHAKSCIVLILSVLRVLRRFLCSHRREAPPLRQAQCPASFCQLLGRISAVTVQGRFDTPFYLRPLHNLASV
jgi:hypothetical protein